MEMKERNDIYHLSLERDKKTIKKIVNDILKEIITELLNERLPMPNKKSVSMASAYSGEEMNFLNFDIKSFDLPKIPQDNETANFNDGILPLILSVNKSKQFLIKEYEEIEENVKRITNAILREDRELNKSSQIDNKDKYTQIKTTKIIMPVFIKHNVTPVLCQQLTRTKYQDRPNNTRDNRSSAKLNKRPSSVSQQSKARKNKVLPKMSSTAQNPLLKHQTSSVNDSARTLSSDQQSMPLSRHALTNSRQTMTNSSSRHTVIIPSAYSVTHSFNTVSSRQTLNSRQTSTSGQLTSAWSGQTLNGSRRTVNDSRRKVNASQRTLDNSCQTFISSKQTIDRRHQNVLSSQILSGSQKPMNPSQKTISRSQQTMIQRRQVSDKDHHIQKHSRITILDTPREILSTQSSSKSHKPMHELSSHNETLQSVLSETSQKKLAKMLLLPLKEPSKSSNVESIHKVPSKVSSIVRRLLKMLPKKSKKQDLIVLKDPEEIEIGHDDFIPPIAGKKGYTLKHNIIRIEDLDDYVQSGSEDHNNESPPDANLDGEDFETGEWFEMPDVDKIFVSTKINVSSGSGIVFYQQGTGFNADVYSKHNIPVKQCSESHYLPVSEEKKSEYLTENFLKSLEHLKMSQGPSLNKFQMEKKLVKYLDDKFNSSDELDEDFREQVKNIINTQESLSKLTHMKKPNRAFEYIIDSKSSEESDELQELLDSIIEKNKLKIDLRALRSKKSLKLKHSNNMLNKSDKSFHKK